MGQTPDDMMGAVIASLAERTGRPIGEWVALVQASGIDPLDQNAVRKWLRSVHGVQQNGQWAIADAAARAAGWVQATHKLSLRSVQDLDDEVLHLLRVAYEQNA